MHSSSFNYGINLGSVQTHIFQFTLLFSSLYYFVPWLKSERLYCHNGSLLAGSSGEMSCLIELNISQMGCVSKILCHQIWQFIGPLFVFLAQERRIGPLKQFKTRRLLLQSGCWFIYKGRSNVSPILWTSSGFLLNSILRKTDQQRWWSQWCSDFINVCPNDQW